MIHYNEYESSLFSNYGRQRLKGGRGNNHELSLKKEQKLSLTPHGQVGMGVYLKEKQSLVGTRKTKQNKLTN